MHCDRAQIACGEVSEISMRAGRALSYKVDDPEGHRWYFGEALEPTGRSLTAFSQTERTAPD
jgi:hypothetical protein